MQASYAPRHQVIFLTFSVIYTKLHGRASGTHGRPGSYATKTSSKKWMIRDLPHLPISMLCYMHNASMARQKRQIHGDNFVTPVINGAYIMFNTQK